MSFLSPLALLGLLLIALPVAVHLLVRRRARRLDVPSLESMRDTPSFKLYPRRVRQPLLLALRAAALILLVLGLARPLFNSVAASPGPLRFILLDASLSMKTRGRAEAARERARAIVSKLARGERAAVITFSSHAAVLAEATVDLEALLEAVGRYEPAGGPADYGAGLAEVASHLRREPLAVAEVDIISDFQRAGIEELYTSGYGAAPWRIVTHPVGQEAGRNGFLVDERAERGASGIELSAAEIISETDGRAGARRAWTLGAGEGALPGLEWRTEANGQVTGRMIFTGADDVDDDDERFFAFSPPREARVLLIEDGTDASLYLGAALGAAAEGEGVAALERRREVPGDRAELAPFSLIVATLDSAPREGQLKTLTEYALGGGTVWLWLARGLDPEALGALAGTEAGRALPFEGAARADEGVALSFGAADAGAPALRALDESALAALRSVRIRSGYRVNPRAWAETLLRWGDGSPALVSGRAGEGEILLLATSPGRDSGDLGASPAFPALVSSVLRATTGTREPLSRTVGEPVRLGIAPESEVRITDASDRVSTAKARELVARPAAYFGKPGIYALEFGGWKKFLAFNPPAAESERELASADDIKGLFPIIEDASAAPAVEASAGRTAKALDSAWRYFLAAAFLLLVGELYLAVRGGRPLPSAE